ncbi:ribonuclease [Corynebacterium sp. ES2794-CONJ1]|uniref:ribonuclease domain-containing protein n=1 Tax=unclassified Corynebacterium TaxID=2624378 RepID=UPI0021680C32|nr:MULTISPECIES: ribonuclease domain-containing protein [unclassified Corynebacterium]MCS4490596.1 ribonuclease [Corynebacterium sp. ES2775-CONJ]MCS4492375.1 ribonuclease [Corynebacterium sp. ES2715-CONJ3]MCS4532433.1 ribonuclease [Corynebacterium sp. ES2730-CONJ]MCU9519828.1 ribonuclease [Corynebacterium sp. ES2794-CONJ1]
MRRLLVALGGVMIIAMFFFGEEFNTDMSYPDFPGNAFSECYVKDLPDQAWETIRDIRSGGPYDFPADDNRHFGNYEGLLPLDSQYREYTVKTPGLNHRGPLRIVTGGGSDTDPDRWYFSPDHYQSFCLIPDAESNRLTEVGP